MDDIHWLALISYCLMRFFLLDFSFILFVSYLNWFRHEIGTEIKCHVSRAKPACKLEWLKRLRGLIASIKLPITLRIKGGICFSVLLANIASNLHYIYHGDYKSKFYFVAPPLFTTRYCTHQSILLALALYLTSFEISCANWAFVYLDILFFSPIL